MAEDEDNYSEFKIPNALKAILDDDGMSYQEIVKFADSNRPEIAQIAQDFLNEIDSLVMNLNYDVIQNLSFTPLQITEDIAGEERTRRIGGASGGLPRRQESYDELTEAGYDIDDNLEYYAENFSSQQWQDIKLGRSSIRDEAVKMWEDETGLDYDDFESGVYVEEDDY